MRAAGRTSPAHGGRGSVLIGAAAVAVVLCVGAALYLSAARAADPGHARGAEQAREDSGDLQGFAAAPRRDDGAQYAPPDDNALRLTVPELARAKDVPVSPSGPSGRADGASLRRGALHVRGTGFPWQRGANTYVAGHRLGFPGTRSHLLFWDLDELEKGDRVLLEDASGRLYEYAVFRKAVVGPDAVRVTAPVPGKSVVSLQTCTLPDYADRLIVQAELVGRRA